ncbi:MAG TPA: NADPH:quinone oxidoreductase family protein [Rhodospirillales bacterium]|nr:NADPH:quinone oxidoreductase family protein [Rhodospirillales bacterium]
MRAVVCKAWGEPESLTLEDVKPSALGPGAVRIAVKACGVNFADVLLVAGTYQTKPDFPFSPGLEVAGEVLECAPDVGGLESGQRVVATVDHGGFAEQVVASAERVIPIPAAMDFTSAAAFPVAYGTSHLGLTYKAGLKAGETLLVLGASGGVGLTAVEIGKKMGATVIACAGGPEKLKVAAEYGADHLIDYAVEDIRARAKELTEGRGVDVVYDPVGGAAFDAAMSAAARGGRVLIVGFASGKIPQIPANILLVKNITAIGYYWGGHWTLDPALVRRSFDALFEWYGKRALRPRVSHSFDLADAAAALRTLIARKSTGKIVITVGE